MANVFEKNKCCGCSACAKICPVHAITMTKNEEGFIYPEIDQEKCINCGACRRICAFNNQKEKTNENLKVYAVQNKNNKLREKATSGGFFNIIASWIIEKNGVVYGAVLNENLIVEHQRTESKEELEKFYGSKYVQSNVESVYDLILKDIKNNKLVLFTGTPCQVAEINRYCEDNHCNMNNLITCDFICHRSTH